MNYSYMIQHSEPMIISEYPVADCYVRNTNVTQNSSLGLDYAGGRIVATPEELLKFMNVK